MFVGQIEKETKCMCCRMCNSRARKVAEAFGRISVRLVRMH